MMMAIRGTRRVVTTPWCVRCSLLKTVCITQCTIQCTTDVLNTLRPVKTVKRVKAVAICYRLTSDETAMMSRHQCVVTRTAGDVTVSTWMPRVH